MYLPKIQFLGGIWAAQSHATGPRGADTSLVRSLVDTEVWYTADRQGRLIQGLAVTL